MSIICKLFGHKIKEYSYGKYWGGTVDGLGTEHGFYNWECERCKKKVTLYIHVPNPVNKIKPL
jgi:hypothetical protein